MIDTPHILQTTAQPVAVIPVTVPRSQIQDVMGPGLSELMATLGSQGVTPTGPWFTRHWRMDPKVFDFEIGVPVAQSVIAAGRVKPSELPATTVARTVYHGDYEGLGGAWQEFVDWIVAHGHTPAEWLWETYLTDPAANPDPGSWRTELTKPLE